MPGNYDGCIVLSVEEIDSCMKDSDGVWRIHKLTVRHWKCDAEPIFRDEVIGDVGTATTCVPD